MTVAQRAIVLRFMTPTFEVSPVGVQPARHVRDRPDCRAGTSVLLALVAIVRSDRFRSFANGALKMFRRGEQPRHVE